MSEEVKSEQEVLFQKRIDAEEKIEPKESARFIPKVTPKKRKKETNQ